ncbi:MAG: putative peptidoglycan glycosyltransferase FtsW [Gemmatimonadota bacterium]
MTARPMDVAPAGPVSFPDTGLGKGWEGLALMIITLVLLSFGVVNLYSASAFLAQRQGLPDTFYVVRQASGALAGVVILLAVARIPYTFWRWMAWPILAATWALLLLTVVPGTEALAPEINGARRWLVLGVAFQPSELAKLAVIIWTAALAVKKEDHFRSLSRGLLPFLLIWALLLVPILLQPDLSTAALVGLLGAFTLFAAGARVGHFLFMGLLLSPLLLRELLVGYRFQRILAFRDVSEVAQGAGYQVQQSLIALGSGGVAGVGFGEGRQKFGFLPEPHNDFIFSMVGEEWGFLGVVFLVSLFVGLVVLGFRVARRAPDAFGELLAVGCANFLALHATLHMAVGLGLVPATGLALPLVSYGRSNLLVTLVVVGLLLSVARSNGRELPLHA